MTVDPLHTGVRSKRAIARIVLVEDNDEVRRSLMLLLRVRGFSVEAYRTGVELLSTEFLPNADCFLIDYKMPSLNGVDLLARLRGGGVTAPAVMLTGFLTTYLTERALGAGFVRIIEKPPENDALLRCICSVI